MKCKTRPMKYDFQHSVFDARHKKALALSNFTEKAHFIFYLQIFWTQKIFDKKPI